MKRHRYLVYLIGIAGFALLIRFMDWNAVWDVAAGLDPYFLLLAALMSLTVQLIKPLSWQVLLKIAGQGIGRKEALRISLIGAFWGGVTPARIGDFCRVVYVRRLLGAEAEVGKLISTVLMTRLMEIVIVIGVSMSGLLFYPASYALKIVFLLALVLFLAVAVFYHFRRRLKQNVLWIFEKIDSFHPVLSLAGHALDIWEGLRSVKDARMKTAVGYHSVAYVFFYIGIIFLTAAFSLPVSPFYVCIAVSTAMAVSILPISVAGLGTRDAVLLVFFLPHGVSYDQTLFFSMIYLLIFIVFPSMIGAVVYFLQPAGLRAGALREAQRLRADGPGKEAF